VTERCERCCKFSSDIIWNAHQALHNQWSDTSVADADGCADCHADMRAVLNTVWDDIRRWFVNGCQDRGDNPNWSCVEFDGTGLWCTTCTLRGGDRLSCNRSLTAGCGCSCHPLGRS
jgi:hypothetical protein